jgi:spermidine synthase
MSTFISKTMDLSGVVCDTKIYKNEGEEDYKYIEQQDWGTTSYTVVKGTHTSFTTEKAQIDLITNPYFGRMLFIDGVLQCASVDEHIYHQALVSKGLGYRPQTRVLVAGGGEGATIREVQNHCDDCGLGLQEIVMVDWDRELVEYMRHKEDLWAAQGSFDDSRVSLYHEDIFDFLKNDKRTYSTIILDLLDPESEEDYSFLETCIQSSLTQLEQGGNLILNLGGERFRVHEEVERLQKVFPTKTLRLEEIHVPSFQQPWYLLILS